LKLELVQVCLISKAVFQEEGFHCSYNFSTNQKLKLHTSALHFAVAIYMLAFLNYQEVELKYLVVNLLT